MAELDDDELELNDEKAPQPGLIARPNATSSMPPVIARGLTPPAAAPLSAGSIEDLEGKALSSHLAPRPIAKPSPIQEQTDTDQNEMSRLQTTGSGISQIAKAHPIAGGILRGLDTVGNIIAPKITARIPGTEEHHQQLIGQQSVKLGEDLGQQDKETTIGKNQAETDKAEAEAEKDRQQASVAANPKEGLTPEEKTIHDLMTGENGQPRINPQTQKPFTYLEAYGATKQAAQDAKPEPKKNDFEQFYADWIKDNNFPDTAHNRLLARKQFAAAGQPPQHDPRQLVIGPGGKVIELHPGDVVPEGSKTVSGDLTNKPTPDEQRRADLSENLNENLATLEDIVTRRPDLFGPVMGRVTGVRQMIGSDDPDIGALETIKHQIGMAQVSAHGMRSAQGVGAAAESILNSFKNGPDAVKASIAAARNSVKTFTEDVNKTQNRGAQNGSSDKATSEAPEGTRIQVGNQVQVKKGGKWVPEQP
jgi:hypothetical protein